MATISDFIGTARYNHEDQCILSQANGHIAGLLGWGTIQRMFHEWKEADNFTRSLGQFIADAINEKIEREKNPGQVSDGYHTFAELYEFRKVYNAALFNEWARQGLYEVHKSWRHHDGDWCFGGGWFIVVAILPTGQISNHYEAKDWDLFKIQEAITAQYEFDGHTPKDVIERLSKL